MEDAVVYLIYTIGFFLAIATFMFVLSERLGRKITDAVLGDWNDHHGNNHHDGTDDGE